MQVPQSLVYRTHRTDERAALPELRCELFVPGVEGSIQHRLLFFHAQLIRQPRQHGLMHARCTRQRTVGIVTTEEQRRSELLAEPPQLGVRHRAFQRQVVDALLVGRAQAPVATARLLQRLRVLGHLVPNRGTEELEVQPFLHFEVAHDDAVVSVRDRFPHGVLTVVGVHRRQDVQGDARHVLQDVAQTIGH